MDVREKLALAVCNATQKTNYRCEFNCEKKGKCAYCLVMAEQMIANGVTVQEWISVKDRLPEDRQKVLCFKQGKYAACVMTAAFSKCLEKYCNVDFHGVKHGGFFDYDSEVGYYELRDVTHWMPLPEAPKGE